MREKLWTDEQQESDVQSWFFLLFVIHRMPGFFNNNKARLSSLVAEGPPLDLVRISPD